VHPDAGADLSEAIYEPKILRLTPPSPPRLDDERLYLRSPDFAGTSEFHLSTAKSPTVFVIADPLVSDRHALWARVRRESGLQATLVVKLMQAAVEIASFEVNPGIDWTTVRYPLSAAEADLISDFGNLRIKLAKSGVAGSRILVNLAELELPRPGDIPAEYSPPVFDPILAHDGVSWRFDQPYFPLP
jgi:hypothetical protein